MSLDEVPPDHSTVSRTPRRIALETNLVVFNGALQRLDDAGLVGSKTVGIDATTLEANAALRRIVRRDTGEGYETFLRGLAATSGIPTPTCSELARLDRNRLKKGPTTTGPNPQDPDATITKMKDGKTRLAHKAERAVDLETGAVVGVRVQDVSTVIQISSTCGVHPLKWTASGGRIDRRWGYQEVNQWSGIAATALSSSAKWRSGATSVVS